MGNRNIIIYEELADFSLDITISDFGICFQFDLNMLNIYGMAVDFKLDDILFRLI